MRVRVTGINLNSAPPSPDSFNLSLSPVTEDVDSGWGQNIGPIQLPLKDVSNYKIGGMYDLTLTPAKLRQP